MKLAIVHNLPAGGQKRALYEQVKRLSTRRHLLDLFTLSSTDESFLSLSPFVRKHIKTPYNPPPHFPMSVLSVYTRLPQAYRILAESINDGKYDAVYVNPCYLTQAPYILRFLKTPSLYYCPEPKREFYEKIPRISNLLTYYATYPFRLPIKDIDIRNTKSATRIITNSYYSKAKIDKIYQVKSYINYLGVDNNLFHPAPVKKEKTVLTVGDFSLHKGHDFLIRSLSLIPSEKRPKLVIIGHSGVEKKYLLKLAAQFGVNVEIYGNISDSELVSWYNRARLFVYAPHHEPFGMALLEAAACNLPVVAVDEGGISEALQNYPHAVLTDRDENRFGQEIKFAIETSYLQSSIEAKNGQFLSGWSWDNSVNILEKHLKEICA
ncbi:glycosyltransferase family 4 protein [Patescibacteria group bacterium]|nr:glycosyltransferase family 4 protein [Patescibacteria group bacterium]MCL5798225.1 glycosyltransferase family 4 protein [Patescibacteria group bacterium]